jgi:S-disulfanyl-L-cysteine oxidoreductase SoxD
MRFNVILAAGFLTCGVGVSTQGPTYKLGRTATAAETRPSDLTVGPDGLELPPGSGTAAQGAATFVARRCSNCHGPSGTEGPAPRLVGPRAPAAGRGRGRAAMDTHDEHSEATWMGRGIENFPFAPLIWSYINQSMPLNMHGFLTTDEVYRLTAFLLFRNGIIQEDDVMDAKSLPQVRMPRRDDYAPPPFTEWKPGLRQATQKK